MVVLLDFIAFLFGFTITMLAVELAVITTWYKEILLTSLCTFFYQILAMVCCLIS